MRIQRTAFGIVALLVLIVPSAVLAQASITGVVKDSSGAILPGVTVEVSSPALIEKVRTAVTDGSGLYRIVNLPPGTYAVVFTLTGFNTFRREGVQVSPGFTANIDGDMRLGNLQETGSLAAIVNSPAAVAWRYKAMRQPIVALST